MSIETLTKTSKRSIRRGCPTCGNEGPFYEAKDQDGNTHFIVRNAYTLTRDQGADIPLTYLHTCTTPAGGEVPGPFADPADFDRDQQLEKLREKLAGGDVDGTTPDAGTSTSKRKAAAEAIAKALAELDEPQQVDEAQVRKIVEEMTRDIVAPTKTVVLKDQELREVDGVTHKQFEDIMQAMASGLNVQLVGGPGVGKTHVTKQAADALGVDFYAIGFHLQSTASELKGYMSANGDFVWTVVYEWATNPNGGVLLNDELDRSHPGIQAALNSLLSNRWITFPNRETVQLTDAHVIIACTNTWGDGPTWEFPAAQKFSAEFKDRFIAIEMDIDPEIEMAAALAKGADLDVTRKAVEYVRTVRANVRKQAINGVVVSPRASQAMAALLARGVDWDKAVRWSLRKGMDDDTWRKVEA